MSAKASLLCILQGASVTQDNDERRVIRLTADMDVDADGMNGQSGKWAYRPGNTGWEDLANAGYPNHPAWYRNILVCDNNGDPIIVNGGYISRTAYEWRDEPDIAKRFVDAARVPYIVVSPMIRKKSKGKILGCSAKVLNKRNGLWVMAGVLDIGPLFKVGEGSCACCEAIGLSNNPRNGGTSEFEIEYEIYPDEPFVFDGRTYDLIAA